MAPRRDNEDDDDSDEGETEFGSNDNDDKMNVDNDNDDDDDDDEEEEEEEEEEEDDGNDDEGAAADTTSGPSEADDDDDDDDDEYEESKKKKPPPPAASASKKKKKKDVSDDDDDDDDDDESVERKKKKKKKASAAAAKKKKQAETESKKRKAAASSKTTSNKKARTTTSASSSPDKVKSSSSATATAAGRSLKKLDKTERLQYAMQSFLWWNAAEPPPGYQWCTMEHSGVCFPDSYVAHHIQMKYDGNDIELTEEQEEAATFFASMDPDGMHLGNAKTAKIFIKNFFDDFKKILGKKHVIKDFKKCDFEPIRKYLNEQKIIKKAITDQQKKANKTDRDLSLHKYGYAIVDGHIERVGNYNMEPPGAFRGRGEHPKMGKLKQRVTPEQVSLNMSECAAVPRLPSNVPGHAWSDVRHDPTGQWLATWKENINNQSKYMQLAAQSSFKGKSDRSKYGKAAMLCNNIDKIRKSYKKDLKSKDNLTKQLATATWVIDRLALRVGGEKDTDEEADTVGCCSLRVEHLHFDPNTEGGDNREIELEFLGKDSMLYKQTIDFNATMYNENNGMGIQVYNNLVGFCKKKKSSEQVFNTITPTMLNQHLKQFMDGLSAKVFRTYNASKTLQDELYKAENTTIWKNLSVIEKVTEYNNANREVAILCNHQKSVSKAQETQLENITSKLQILMKQKKTLKAILKRVAADGNKADVPLKKSHDKETKEVDELVSKAKKMKENAKTNADKIAATEADEHAKTKKRELADTKFKRAHLWEKIPTKEQIVKRIETWNTKISKMEMDLKHKDDNKEVSLGTSKINYMDPRISVAFCKRNDIPIEKIFSKTLRDKFNWAMAVSPNWTFDSSVAC